MNTEAFALRKHAIIAVLSIAAILFHLALRSGWHLNPNVRRLPLIAALVLGGIPLVWELLLKFARRKFGPDLLAGISIVTSAFLGEHLAGTLVVMMLSCTMLCAPRDRQKH